MINVIDIPDPGAVTDPVELGLVFPIPGAEKNTVVMEDRDGDHVQRLTATAVDFNANGKTAFRDRKIKIALFITDARFALACSKYDKGGGWVGGAGTVIVFNSVSKARAALRSRGKMLVGQVRYPWIQRIGSSPKTGWASDEKLVFDTSAGQDGAMRLTVTLPKNVEAARVACEIAQRAARYRLASEDIETDARTALEQLAVAEPLTGPATDASGIRFFEIPGAKIVSEDSARISPSTAGHSA